MNLNTQKKSDSTALRNTTKNGKALRLINEGSVNNIKDVLATKMCSRIYKLESYCEHIYKASVHTLCAQSQKRRSDF